MKRRITPLLRSLWLAPIFLTPLAMAEIGPYAPKLSPDGKLGIMGDSLALGVHASEMCGNDDSYECAQQLLGASSPDWSYVAADKSWSIASLLGFDTIHLVAAFGAGEEWKDALDQAMTIMTDPLVEAVFIGLGANNVCTPQGHDYTDDLVTIAGHIDATLSYLTDTLPPGGRIYWSGVLDVLQLRDLMRRRDHNFWFETCQGTWDLDDNKIKDEAANDVCDHFFDHTACQLASVIEEAKDELMNLLFNRWLDLEGVDEGPCGKVLSSRSTDADRVEARQFNLALNQLMSAKAAEYDGRNGVAVYYSDRIFEASANLTPYHVSRLDCFHPSRAGQIFLANETWHGFDPFTEPVSRYFFDEFDSQDYCVQEYTTWDSCWTEIGEDNGPTAGDIQINVRELRVRDNNKGIMRSLDLDGMQATWLQYNWRRESLDNNDDYVSIDVSPDAGVTWYQQRRIKGDGDDYNTHRGYYHDITPYATADTLLRFKGSSDLGGHDEVFFDNITVFGWGAPVLTQDTDQDGLLDAAEDRNGNGVVDIGETDRLDSDSDDDGLLDGAEDRNGNGVIDIGETDPLDSDSDNDGLLDGAEDRNGNGVIDTGETDPLDSDSDDDGLIDGIETNTGTFINASDTGTDPNNPDTDGDGFDDAVEVTYGSDPHNNTDTPTVNDAPTISGTPPAIISEGSTYSFTPASGDVDGDTLLFSITNKPDWASFNTATGELSGTPTNADVGTTVGIVITVDDQQNQLNSTASLSAFDLEVTNGTAAVIDGPLDKAQQACVNKMNKNGEKVNKAQLKQNEMCLKDFQNLELSNFEQCITSPPSKGKVQKAQAKTDSGEDKKCVAPLPTFAYTNSDTVNGAAVDGALALIDAIFGDPVDDANLATRKAGKEEKSVAKCQLEMLKQANKLENTVLKVMNKAKKKALKEVSGSAGLEALLNTALGSDKVVKTAMNLIKEVDKKCLALPDPDTIFPGACTNPDLRVVEDCVNAAARRQACLKMETFDDLDLNCD